MKIVSSGGTLASPGFLEKKQKARRKRLAIFVGIVMVLLIGSVLILRMKSLRISAVTVSGAQAIDAAKLEAGVREALEGNFLYIIPRDSALLYRNSQIQKEVMEKFPRFSSVDLSLNGSSSLEVTVTERKPHALYCGEQVSTGSGGSCYFLDKTGFIYDYAPGFSDGVYFVYSHAVALDKPLGSQYLPVDQFASLSLFIEKLPSLGLSPLSVELGNGEFRVRLANGAVLHWFEDMDVSKIYSNLDAFLKSPAIAGDPGFLSRIAELDLGIEDKVRWTFQE